MLSVEISEEWEKVIVTIDCFNKCVLLLMLVQNRELCLSFFLLVKKKEKFRKKMKKKVRLLLGPNRFAAQHWTM